MHKQITMHSLAIIILGSTVLLTGASQAGEAKIEPITNNKVAIPFPQVKLFEIETPNKQADEPKVEEVEMIKRPQIDNVPLSDELLDYIYDVCEENDIPYSLMLAIIAVESNFNPKLISPTADYGLTQIHKPNIKSFAEAAGIENVDPFNPKHSILMTAYYLTYLKNYWSDMGLSEEHKFYAALLSYNRGTNSARNWIRTKGWTNTYVSKISKVKNEMESNTY